MENKPQSDWGEALTLDSRFGVFPGKSLPDLNGAGGPAYAASLKNDLTQELFAVVCSQGLLPRVESVSAMKLVDSPASLKLRTAGPLLWPSAGAHYYTLIFEKPLASRYWKSFDETHPVMNEDTVLQTFVVPMLKTLSEYQRTGFVHGGIRPTNIFWIQGSASAPQVGEALSAPCGVGQPAMFETIERAMCQPIARGGGTHAIDCYAFGITLAMVCMGLNPFRGMDDEAILKAKMEKGSFNAVIGNRRLPPSQIELLRGLLTDDEYQRWSAEDIDQWMSGRRLTSKSTDAGRHASRHFDIGGKEYWQIKPLVRAMGENVVEAAKLVENGALEKWLTRSLGDEQRAKNVAEAIEQLRDGGKSAHYQDQLVARACIALDPLAPIHYRGLSVLPLGIAPYLAHALTNGENLQVISEIIALQFVTLWVNMQRDSKTDLVPLAQQMERMRGFLERNTYGDGLERVLYELNPGLPCLSPLVRDAFVVSPRHLLPALEHTAAQGAIAGEPMDRHLAAFILAREKRTDTLFAAMGPGENPLRRGLALLSLFGDMQYRYGPDSLPHLAAWLMPLVEPCFDRYLSRPLREKVRRQAQEAAKRGQLAVLLEQVDNPTRVSGDEQDFLAARLMYLKVQREIATIENDMANKGHAAREFGRPVAAAIASFLAIILMAVTIIRALMGG